MCRAHPAWVGDLELLDELQGPQPLAQVGLVGGGHDSRHAGQAMDCACAGQPLVEVALHAATTWAWTLS